MAKRIVSSGHRYIDLTGKRFGRWTVLSYAGNCGRYIPRWLCRCDCGTEREVIGKDMVAGKSVSCGCYFSEQVKLWNVKHGLSHDQTFNIYRHMIARCHNEKGARYADYGGRGITVCQRWRDSYEAFLDDMGPRPSPKHEIERKNNDGNYEPDNCIWATRHVQARNKRSSRFLEHNGERMVIVDWERRQGFLIGTISKRLIHGWTVEEAITTPVGSVRRKRGVPSP